MNKSARCIPALAFLFLFAACNKPQDDVVPPQVRFLSVKLQSPYLDAAAVDSAFATWKINGQEQRVRLQLAGDSLKADVNNWPEGAGELELHIFSNKKYSNQYFGQWVFQKPATIQSKSAIRYNGPASFTDAAWFPRVQLKDAIGHEAIVALRPDDAYFLVKNPGHNLSQLTVDRGYWKTAGSIALAGRDMWRCNTNCTDVANEEYFRSLPQRIGTKSWNHISIAILFEINDDGQGWVLSLEHEP